jgi:hypothetical protein
MLFMKGTAQFPHVRLFRPRHPGGSRPAACHDGRVKTFNVLEDEEDPPGHQGLRQLADHPAALHRR